MSKPHWSVQLAEYRLRLLELDAPKSIVPEGYYESYQKRIDAIEERGRQWIKGEHGYFAGSISTGGGGKSGKSVDKPKTEEYNLYRKTSNTGEFSVFSEPMQLRHVKTIVKNIGIDYKGIEFDIIRDKELIGKAVFGYTFPNGRKIQLYPDAFSSREELVKTLGHELIHCHQIKLFGNARNFAELLSYERAAKFSEDYWWSQYIKRTGYNENK